MYSAIITAAGVGSRAGLGYNKMLYKKNEVTILEIIVKKFVDFQVFDEIIVTASETDFDTYNKILCNYPVEIVIGGNERMDSVYNGVKKAKNKLVFIHDGARIFLNKDLIMRLVNFEMDFDGLALALKSIDTTLMVEDDKIIKILNRDSLYTMQTPQVVNKEKFIQAYKYAKKDNVIYTDEMSMLTTYGFDCKVVEGEAFNKKLTKPEDFKE